MNQKIDGDVSPNDQDGLLDPPDPTPAELIGLEEETRKIEESVNGTELEQAPVGRFYFRIAKSYPVLSSEEVVDLAKKIEKGDDKAREKLILHNLCLVMYVAWKNKDRGVEVDDLIQIGNIALMEKAVVKFDYRRGYRFSTYAIWWIRQFISRAIADQRGPVRVPINRQEKSRRIRKIASELSMQLGRRATADEIAEETGYKKEKVDDILRNSGMAAFSLDEPSVYDDGGETSRHESFADPNGLNPFTIVSAHDEAKSLCNEVKTLLQTLAGLKLVKERDKNIFRRFYGLDEYIGMRTTLEFAGQEFKLTRERVRQVVRNLWRTLKKVNPHLDLDENSMAILHERINELEISTNSQVAIADLLDLESVDTPIADMPTYRKSGGRKSSSWGLAGLKSKRIAHIRASPAFVHWRPSKAAKDCPAQAAVELAAMAYEMSAEDLKHSSKKECMWAKRVAAYIMRNDLGMKPSEFSPFIANDGKTYFHLHTEEKINSVIGNDAAVREDIEGIRAHFRKIMG